MILMVFSNDIPGSRQPSTTRRPALLGHYRGDLLEKLTLEVYLGGGQVKADDNQIGFVLWAVI